MKEYYKSEQIYIIGVSSLKRLGIRFVPSNFTLSSIPQPQDIFIVGRNLPETQIPSGQDTLSLTLDIIAEEQMMNDVRDKCNWLRSLRYTKSRTEPQERVRLVWGTFMNREVWVVRNCVIRYEHFMRNFGGMPKRAEVDLLLGLDGIGTSKNNRSKNVYQDDIQNLGSPFNGQESGFLLDPNTRIT